MSEVHLIKARCGYSVTVKIWKQGGSAKCPGHWSFNTYPKPTLSSIKVDIDLMCKNCDDQRCKTCQPSAPCGGGP